MRLCQRRLSSSQKPRAPAAALLPKPSAKSQGSEFAEVIIAFPDDDLPLASRELLYTALTRARQAAVLAGKATVITAACRRTSSRASGLAGRLAAALSSHANRERMGPLDLAPDAS